MGRGAPSAFRISSVLLWLCGSVSIVVALSGCAAPPAPPPVTPKPGIALDAAGTLDANSPLSTQSGVRGMTFEEVQKCAEDKLRLVRDSEAANQRYAGLTADKQSIARAGEALELGRLAVDATDEAAVDAYNENVRLHRQAVVSLNSDVDAYNQRAEALSRQSRAFGLSCSNRPFRSNDTDRLPDELRDVWKTDLHPFDDIPVFYTDEPTVTDVPPGDGPIIIGGPR